jgi:hypothetical protein
MNRLRKFKEWHSVDDAARYLEIGLGERVTSADVLRLALDGHLKLSVHLVNGAFARPLFPVDAREVVFEDVPSLDGEGVVAIATAGPINNFGGPVTFQMHKAITELDATVWNLPLLGAERLGVEHQFQMLSGGPAITLEPIDDPVLVASTNGRLFALQHHHSENQFFKGDLAKPYLSPKNFYPAGGLPDDAVLVVRAASLHEFERLAMGDDSPFEAPYLDADAPDYPALLHIALQAWEHARKGGNGTPKQRVIAFLAERYESLPQNSRDAIAQVANWHRAGGRPAKGRSK